MPCSSIGSYGPSGRRESESILHGVILSSRHRSVLARVADPGSRYLVVDVDDPDREVITALAESLYVEVVSTVDGRQLVQLTARGANELSR